MTENYQKWVDEIAEEIVSISKSNLWYCDCCDCEKTEDELREDSYECAVCGYDCVERTIGEYLENRALDVDLIISIHEPRNLKAVKVCITLGGPNIYIETEDQKVKLYSGGDCYEAELPAAVCAKIVSYYEGVLGY